MRRIICITSLLVMVNNIRNSVCRKACSIMYLCIGIIDIMKGFNSLSLILSAVIFDSE